MKIVLLDSLQLIPESLSNILDSFKCSVQKGNFPYSFVNKNNLYYIGDKPNKEHFESISDQEYLDIPKDNWSLEQETLIYLKADVEGLLEVMLKFNNNIFSNYQLNITKYKTLSSLALATYISNYIPKSLVPELKMIKGELEREIRSSYFGGNVDVFINKINNGFLYDMNSQYPKAMLLDMPIGEPVLSFEKDLNKIFGFIYGEICCPDEQILQVPFIQYKDPFFKVNSCPTSKRGKFKRLIFSQEIKYALKYGYTINIEYCYQFNRGKDLFKNYIIDHYEIKKSASDPVERAVAKLFLNSLYGRLGMKEIENIMKIISKKDIEDLDKNTNISVLSELDNGKYLVRYRGQINDNIRKLYSKDPLLTGKNKQNNSKYELKKSGINKSKTVPSAVHIAAAITSYARILINDYKNIPGNPCIMSDTDSAVLPYQLSNNLVGYNLGQMKLVHKIKKGIFIKKKLYCIVDNLDKEFVAASGIDSSKLNYNSFTTLLKGEPVEIERTNFNVD